VQELLDRGLLTAEEAANHPNSNVITRAVGGAPELYLDVALVDIRPGDLFVLCSDGLYNELGPEDIDASLDEDVDASADRLLATALERGARDNVSLVVLRAEGLA
jgi:protein phosphatase